MKKGLVLPCMLKLDVLVVLLSHFFFNKKKKKIGGEDAEL
jgi:hypothetical protein